MTGWTVASVLGRGSFRPSFLGLAVQQQAVAWDNEGGPSLQLNGYKQAPDKHEMARWIQTRRWDGIHRLPHHLPLPRMLPAAAARRRQPGRPRCSRKPNVSYISLVVVEHFTAGGACLQPAACQIWRSPAEGRRGAGYRCCS